MEAWGPRDNVAMVIQCPYGLWMHVIHLDLSAYPISYNISVPMGTSADVPTGSAATVCVGYFDILE